MGKLTVLRTMLVVSTLGAVAVPSTESFAKNWFERVFSPPSAHQPRKRAPRASRHHTTPAVAPIPATRPDNEPPVTAEESAAALAYAGPEAAQPAAPFSMPQPAAAGKAPPSAAPEQVTAAPAVAPAQQIEAKAQAGADSLASASPAQMPAQGTIDLRKSVPDASDIVAETDAGLVVAAIAAPARPSQALQPAPIQGPPAPEDLAAGGEVPDQALPADMIPVPEPNPRVASVVRPDEALPEKSAPAQQAALPMLPDPRTTMRPDPSGKLPADEVACRARLTDLGVKFENSKAQANQDVGCTLPYPIVVSSFGGGIDVSPNAEMNCAMAEASARFMQNVVSPAAKAELGTTLKGISQASSYVCRPRHGTRKLSEHAFGNALDLAAFEMADKSSVEVEMTPPTEKEKRFLDAIRKAACGPFKTVLGPGSDADHALHFHLDLEPRRRGNFCQ